MKKLVFFISLVWGGCTPLVAGKTAGAGSVDASTPPIAALTEKRTYTRPMGGGAEHTKTVDVLSRVRPAASGFREEGVRPNRSNYLLFYPDLMGDNQGKQRFAASSLPALLKMQDDKMPSIEEWENLRPFNPQDSSINTKDMTRWRTIREELPTRNRAPDIITRFNERNGIKAPTFSSAATAAVPVATPARPPHGPATPSGLVQTPQTSRTHQPFAVPPLPTPEPHAGARPQRSRATREKQDAAALQHEQAQVKAQLETSLAISELLSEELARTKEEAAKSDLRAQQKAEELQRTAAALQQSENALRTAQSELAAQQRRQQALVAEMDNLRLSKAGEAEAALADYAKQLETAREQSQQALAESAQARADHSAVQQQLKVAQDEKTALEAQLAAKKKRVAEEAAKLKAASDLTDTRLAEAEKDAAEAKKQAEDLQRQLSEQQAGQDQLAAQHQTKEAELTEALRTSKAALQVSEAASQSAAAQAESLRKSFESRASSVSRSTAELASAQAELAASVAQNKENLARITQLGAELTAARTAKEGAEASTRAKEQELTQLKEAHATNQQRLQNAHDTLQHQVTELETQLKQSRERTAELEEGLAEAQRQAATHPRTDDDLNVAMDALREQLQGETDKNAELQGQKEELTRHLAAAKKEQEETLQKHTQQLQESSQKLQEARDALREAQASTSSLASQTRSASHDVAASRRSTTTKSVVQRKARTMQRGTRKSSIKNFRKSAKGKSSLQPSPSSVPALSRGRDMTRKNPAKGTRSAPPTPATSPRERPAPQTVSLPAPSAPPASSTAPKPTQELGIVKTTEVAIPSADLAETPGAAAVSSDADETSSVVSEGSETSFTSSRKPASIRFSAAPRKVRAPSPSAETSAAFVVHAFKRPAPRKLSAEEKANRDRRIARQREVFAAMLDPKPAPKASVTSADTDHPVYARPAAYSDLAEGFGTILHNARTPQPSTPPSRLRPRGHQDIADEFTALLNKARRPELPRRTTRQPLPHHLMAPQRRP